MRIRPLRTGSVRVKHAFLHPRAGMRRQLDLFLPGPWSDPLPIHCWAVEHEDRLLLVDTGERATAHDNPFARFSVAPEEELPWALAALGLSIADVDEVVLTHHHGDHVDGLGYVRAPVRIAAAELAFARSVQSRIAQRVFRQPLPPNFAPAPITFDDGPFGAFERSRRLSQDGRIVAVETPGHTPGHLAVICVDDEGRHVFLAGDTTDTLEQLHDRRADAVGPDPAVHVATLDRVLAHAREHPTIYLPSHDPESEARLSRGETV